MLNLICNSIGAFSNPALEVGNDPFACCLVWNLLNCEMCEIFAEHPVYLEYFKVETTSE